MSRVHVGLENFLDNPPLWSKGRKIGLLCHQASVDAGLNHSSTLLHSRFRSDLSCLFSPQHGPYAQKQDNMIESGDWIDESLGIPGFSLYGDTREPLPEHLSLIDMFVVDLQDVGTRVYTYLWTMLLAMRACARQGVTFVVLDRPNPINGFGIEGNLLRRDCYSFIGMAPIPMRHGMTLAELAIMFRDLEDMDLDLHVVKMSGWNRSMYFDQTGLPWVWPSPNMPTLDSAIVYPGQVILEATNISEGRGTTRPFEVFGAPYIDTDIILKRLRDWGVIEDNCGFVLRKQNFEPTFNKWSGKLCRGFQIHVLDRSRFSPYLLSLAVVSAITQEFPDDFSWKPPPYEYEFDRLPADLILGDRSVKLSVERGSSPVTMKSSWEGDVRSFLEMRRDYLLYS